MKGHRKLYRVILCLGICWTLSWHLATAAPFQAVKWPRSSQIPLIAYYKTVIEDTLGNVVQEIKTPYNDALIAWIKDGLLVFENPQDGSGTPVKVVCDYGAIDLAPGEYMVRVVTCNAKDNCSKIEMAPRVLLERRLKRMTKIMDNGARVIKYEEEWITKIEKAQRQDL